MSREEDVEANRFAICLLMPAHFVHTEADKLLAQDPGMYHDEIVSRMARKFQVSEPMMTMRMVELGRLVAP